MLQEVRMSSLKDKLQEEAEVLEETKEKEDVKGKKGKGRRIKSKSKK